MSTAPIAIALFLFQWVNVPLPNTPRLPNGKPNLTAPVPKAREGKPDLTGIWRAVDGKYLQNIAADGVQVPFQPWAEALHKERHANFSKDRPSGRCLPHGVPDSFLVTATPFKIVQTPLCNSRSSREPGSLPADFHGRPRVPEGYSPDVDGIFYRDMGRRYFRGRFDRFQRPDIYR